MVESVPVPYTKKGPAPLGNETWTTIRTKRQPTNLLRRAAPGQASKAKFTLLLVLGQLSILTRNKRSSLSSSLSSFPKNQVQLHFHAERARGWPSGTLIRPLRTQLSFCTSLNDTKSSTTLLSKFYIAATPQRAGRTNKINKATHEQE